MLKLRARNSAEKWKKTVNQLTLEDLKEYWEFHNKTEGKSEKTIKWYNDVLRLLEQFLESEGLSTFIKDIGEPEVRAFIHHLQNKTKWVKRNGRSITERLSSEGVQNRLRVLKAFFNWLYRQGYAEEHRLAGMRNIRVQKKVTEVLTDEEIARILATCDVKEHRGARMHAIITLMLDTGLRFSEVITLEEFRVDIDNGYLKVLGKGNKERMVPFGAASQKTLWRYHKLFRAEPIDTESFFLTEEGYQFTEDGFKSLFRRLAQRSGIPRLHAHLLRHTFVVGLPGQSQFVRLQVPVVWPDRDSPGVQVPQVLARSLGHGLVQSLYQPSPFEVVEAVKPEHTPPPPPVAVVRHRGLVPVPRGLAGTRAGPSDPRAPFAARRRWCQLRTATFQA